MGAAAGPPPAPGEPNPGLAALLGFIPGVGAMYNEQYAKGIVHLMVFAVLVSLASDVNDIFGLFVIGWVFYMVIEAHHTARARRDGTPLPNPFGLNDLSERLGFGKAWPSGVPPSPYAQGPGAPDANTPVPNPPPPNPSAPPYSYSPPVSSWAASPPAANWAVPPDATAYGGPPIPPVPPMPPYPDANLPHGRRFPTGAIWLIGMGLLFLVGNSRIFYVFHGHLMGPAVLIGVGVWLFVRKMTSTGQGLEDDGTAMYRWRLGSALSSSFWVILTGFLWLLSSLHILSWGHSWPLYVIAAGVVMLFRRTMHSGGWYGYVPPPGTEVPSAAAVTTTALVPTDPHAEPGSHDQEGR
jgi:hypothetical protein